MERDGRWRRLPGRLRAVGGTGRSARRWRRGGGPRRGAESTSPTGTDWGNLDPAIAKIVETPEFKEHMGGATLEYKGSTNRDAMLTAIAAGTPPDGASNYNYVELFTRGATIDVTDMVNASTVIKGDDLLEGLWASAFWDGKMMGVPGIEGYLWWGLNVNTDAAQKAGLDTTTLPKTWDEVFEWHKALTKKDDAGNLLQFGLDPYDAMASEPDFIAGSYGFKWWDEATGKFDLANPRMAEGLDTLGEFIRYAGPDQFAGMRQVEGQGRGARPTMPASRT